MREHFKNLFAYNAWGNHLFLISLDNKAPVNSKIYSLMSHILQAEKIWFCRIQKLPAPDGNLWEELSLVKLQEQYVQQKKEWEQYLEGLREEDFPVKVNYHNSKGKQFSTALSDILSHVINHGTYHRAQLAILLRMENIDPPVSDFIAYVRQQEVE